MLSLRVTRVPYEILYLHVDAGLCRGLISKLPLLAEDLC